MRTGILSLGCLLFAVPHLDAQGAISTQGFGYPAGGASTRAAAGGAAFAEFDFASPRNPSSLLAWGRGGLYMQYDPELRSVASGSGSDKTTTIRFPMIAAAAQIGPKTVVSLSSSTFLDRTWSTSVRGGEILGSDSVGYSEFVKSNGAINDIRLAASVSVSTWFAVGLGLHAYTGENRLQLQRTFDDSLRYGSIDRLLTLGYLGTGVSFGATWRPSRNLAVAGSARAGGTFEMRLADSVIASAKVPNRVGFGLRFDGLPGASIAIGAERTTWSRMSALSSSSLVTRDTWEYDVGTELTSPHSGAFPATFYLGFRSRELPFSTTGVNVSEHIYSGGVSLPLSGPRAVADLALERATRGTVSNVSEHAWIVSLGLTIRP